MSDPAGSSKEVARRALEQVCSGRAPQDVAQVYHRDFVDHVNGSTENGHDGVRRSVARYRRTLDGLRFDIDEQVADEAKVASRFTARGTNRGRPVELHGIVISRFQDGRIIEDWVVTDTLDLLRQLGPRRALLLAARLWLDARRAAP